MKFAIVALIANISALIIQTDLKEEAKCVTKELARKEFNALDTKDNGSLTFYEIKVGLKELSKSLDHIITNEEWAWVQNIGY